MSNIPMDFDNHVKFIEIVVMIKVIILIRFKWSLADVRHYEQADDLLNIKKFTPR